MEISKNKQGLTKMLGPLSDESFEKIEKIVKFGNSRDCGTLNFIVGTYLSSKTSVSFETFLSLATFSMD